MLCRLRAPAGACVAFSFTGQASSTSRPTLLSRNRHQKRPSRRVQKLQWASLSTSSPLSPSTPAAGLPAATATSSSSTPPPPGLLVSTPERPLILAFNLCEHELDALRSTGLGWEVLAVGEGEEVGAGSLLDVNAGVVVVAAEAQDKPESPSLSVRATLLVLPAGCTANDGASQALAAYPAAVDEALTEAGCALCVTGVGVGAAKGKDENSKPQPLSDALERLGRAHASVSGIWRPLPRLAEEEQVPKGATLAMAAFLDAAPWDDDDDEEEGGNEIDDDDKNLLDLSGLAVLDGLLSPREASDLLLYLTDGDPSSPQEGERWQRGGVIDHDGGEEEEEEEKENENEPSTSFSSSSSCSSSSSSSSSPPPSSWGATPQFIASLLSDPPPQLLALCSRLRALYSPEFSEVLLCADNGEMSPGLSSLVLNAVTPEDAPSLLPHVDADPLRSDPDGAWARAFGLYRNRSAGSGSGSAGSGSGGQTLPLLATALLYFQDWPLEDAAETLFFDAEETGLGLAVRPRAGRVVVSEQDVVHRIVPPRKKKKLNSSPPNPPPRYSLVLKLALIPKKSGDNTPTSVVLPDWRPRALRLGTAAARGPLPLA